VRAQKTGCACDESFQKQFSVASSQFPVGGWRITGAVQNVRSVSHIRPSTESAKSRLVAIPC
jgi:hypothetical protein